MEHRAQAPTQPSLHRQTAIKLHSKHLIFSLFLPAWPLPSSPPSSNAFRLHFRFPFSLPLVSHAHACNLSDRIPQRGAACLLSSLSSPELVEADERGPEQRGRKQRNGGHSSSGKYTGLQRVYKTPTTTRKTEAKSVVGSTEVKNIKVQLDMCSKAGDVMTAISLYDLALKEGIKLGQYHYNVLLYLCSSAATGVVHPAKSGSSSIDNNATVKPTSLPIHVSDDVRVYARTRGFEIYEHMRTHNIPMSEAALTSVARIAMSMGDGDMAFEMVKQMKELGVTPRLRSYGPALFAFCDSGNVEKAFEVEQDMLNSGVNPEEPELRALLRASVDARRGDKVYYILHKLRTNVRQVSPATADLIEAWFKSSRASRVGKRKLDEKALKKAMENRGGGWHGLGWLGKGKWEVVRTTVDANGICMNCAEKMVTIDLDPIETEKFAKSVAALASKRERNSSFQKFQRWLDYYGPFEAVVDAANVGLFSQRQFSLAKVNAVVNAVRQKLPSKKWPLIIVHNKRLLGRKMGRPLDEKLKEKWKNADAIYETPTGSNDDWYWLYAAIKFKCLIVTNDEMRDHVFQTLGNDFFPRWKERHQVHFSFREGSFELHMPPPCSFIIQESAEGHWHIPIQEEHRPRKEWSWLCVMRSSSHVATHGKSTPHDGASFEEITKRTPSADQSSNIQRHHCHSARFHPNKTIRDSHRRIHNISSTKSCRVVDAIEAAEVMSGSVIDFQI